MDNVIEWLLKLMAAGITIIPLFFTYIFIMAVLKGLGALGGAIMSVSDRSQKGGRGFGQGVGDNLRNKRKSDALEGGGIPGYGSLIRRGARRRAKRGSTETRAKRAETDYIADMALNDDKFAGALAGGDEARKAGVMAAAVAQKKKAFAEDVGDMEALIKVKFDGDPKKALEDALATGNQAQAVAAQNLLFAKGGSGVSDFRKIIEEAEKTEGGKAQLDQVSDSLKENIQERHGKQVKDKGADLVKWAGQTPEPGQAPKSLTDSTAGALSDNDLAGQHAASIGKMVNQNQVSGDQARRVLADPRVSANLNDDQKKELLRAAGGDVRPNPTDKELHQAQEEALVQDKLYDMEHRDNEGR